MVTIINSDSNDNSDWEWEKGQYETISNHRVVLISFNFTNTTGDSDGLLETMTKMETIIKLEIAKLIKVVVLPVAITVTVLENVYESGIKYHLYFEHQ